MTNRNVKLKNRNGDYLLPYTDNIPTASALTAGQVKLDSSPTSGSNNAITSGAFYTALDSVNATINGIETDMSSIQTDVSGLTTLLAGKLNSSALQVVDSKPANPDSSTFYFIKE